MKISIITVCYNRANTISDCIESVLLQDYPFIEYIIVDGASTDGSLPIIRNIERRILSPEFKQIHPHFEIKIISEPDRGMYDAINKGIQVSTGDYIGLVHSDDFLYSTQTVSHIVHKLKNTHADFLYGDGLFVDSNFTERIVRKWISGNYKLWKVKHGWLPLHPTCYIKKEVFSRKGLYNVSYKIAGDSDLLFRYLFVGDMNVVYLPEYIIKMRMGGMSTDKRRRVQMWKEDIRMYQSHGMNATLTKIEKMVWKIPQFIKALFM